MRSSISRHFQCPNCSSAIPNKRATRPKWQDGGHLLGKQTQVNNLWMPLFAQCIHRPVTREYLIEFITIMVVGIFILTSTGTILHVGGDTPRSPTSSTTHRLLCQSRILRSLPRRIPKIRTTPLWTTHSIRLPMTCVSSLSYTI